MNVSGKEQTRVGHHHSERSKAATSRRTPNVTLSVEETAANPTFTDRNAVLQHLTPRKIDTETDASCRLSSPRSVHIESDSVASVCVVHGIADQCDLALTVRQLDASAILRQIRYTD